LKEVTTDLTPVNLEVYVVGGWGRLSLENLSRRDLTCARLVIRNRDPFLLINVCSGLCLQKF
jgi:hypothetical protein